MRRSFALLVHFAVWLTASTSTALTFNAMTTVTNGSPLLSLVPGDLITIDIRMSNPSGAAIFGVGAGVQGWDGSILELVSGEMNPGPYFCTTTACSVGLDNNLPFPVDPDTGNYTAGPTDVQNIAGIGNYLPLVQAISTTGRAGNGARDPGLDGVVNGGDAQFRLVFRFIRPGTAHVDIGTNAIPSLGNVVVLTGGATELATNALISVNVIPEPGSALLVGLGLSGLATLGRRRR